MTCMLHDNQCTVLIIFRSVLLRMHNASDKRCRENKKKIMFHDFFKKICVNYHIMWKNIVQPHRPLMTVITIRMRFACWIA